MAAVDFASSVISYLDSSIGKDGLQYTTGSANIAMVAVANALTQYIVANTIVTVSYAGIIPSVPPSPDPLVIDTFNLVGSIAPTGPSNSFDEWIRLIETNIIAGFTLAPMGKGGLVFAQMPFINPGILTTQQSLYAVHDILDQDPQLKVWTVVCQGIMDWINTIALNVTPMAATHPAVGSTGTAFITNITIT